MMFLRSAARLLMAGMTLGSCAQQPGPGLPDATALPGSVDPGDQIRQARAAQTSTAHFREIDLLRRSSFTVAPQATVTLRVFDRSGANRGLQTGQFTLLVNGTERTGRLEGPGTSSAVASPVVLLVFPPNQPVIHSIGVHQSKVYFSTQPDVLPWRVGILDADGTATTYTSVRSELLASLDQLDHKVEPLQYSTDFGIVGGLRWNGPWLTKAEEAIGGMQATEGARVVLAFNPIANGLYGLNQGVMAQDGPEALTYIAQRMGARIYIANVGGPDVVVPDGDATEHGPPPTSPLFWSPRIYGNGLSGRLTASYLGTLSYFAYRNSLMMTTAQDTFGGFSNSMKELGGQIQRDLDQTYSLTFDLTAKDRDQGVPEVEVRLGDRRQLVSILDIAPLRTRPEIEARAISKKEMDAIWKATAFPVPSPDFRITQHADYFPLHGGLQPELPMSCVVEWTGAGPKPDRVSIAEFVQNISLASSVLEREVETPWRGRGVSWERDGRLYPGQYLWRVVLHDDAGHILASSEQKIRVDYLGDPVVALSSLIVGRSCEGADPFLKRAEMTPQDRERIHFQVDPMRADACRVKPEPTGRFAQSDTLRAFLRLYPSDRVKKQPPESWSAHMALRSSAGALEMERELPFTIDAGSGYLASMAVPLTSPGVLAGSHTLEMHVRGPGIRKEAIVSRQISIAPPVTALPVLPR